MPFYDLKCNECGKEFNVMAKISEREKKLITCPNCGNNELEPIFTNLNFITSRKPDNPVCPNIERCGGCCNF
ncbi:MAG: zinc ribbon domain-containing protein [Firmicutes bacterium]|nr:zinc ribbon domain-containing protein [Bacillota bacterium]